MCASYGTRWRWRARGDRSPRATPQRPLRSLYIRERAARARALGSYCSCFSLSLCRQSLRHCRRSSLISAERLASALLSALVTGLVFALISARVSADVLLSSLPALSSRLCSASVSSLPRLRLSLVACDYYTCNKLFTITHY